MTDLPDSWELVEIPDVLEANNNGKPFQQGWSPRCETTNAPMDKWGVLKTTAIQHGEFWEHENKLLPDHLEPRPHIEVKPGDVLMTCAGPRSRCGVACFVERTRPKLMMSGKMYRFRPNPELMCPKYLEYFLQSRDAQLSIDRMKTGINDSGLNLTHNRFATLQIAVPPINEQRRIVAKLEELLSEAENGVQNLKEARDQLTVYRQAVLKHAFEGKLTADWRRTKNTADVEKPDPELTIRERDAEGLTSLPEGWSYTRLGSQTDPERPITYGVIKLGPEVSDGVPTLRSSDVRKLRIDTSSVKKISRKIANQYGRTFLKGGELLITVRGTLGGISIVSEKFSGWNISREVAMIVPKSNFDPSYLQFMLASPQIEAWFQSRLRGVAYTGINLETLRQAPVIYCSKSEQRQVAKVVEERLSAVDSAKQEIVNQIEKIEVLRQSIFRKAFSGRLVEQNPNDEPASELLERIKAEKVDQGQAKANKKGKTRDAA